MWVHSKGDCHKMHVTGRRWEPCTLGSISEWLPLDQALSMLLFREELVAGIAAIGGSGGVVSVFENDRKH
jgi:hypothetical protein